MVEAALLEINKQIASAVCALAVAICQAQDFLLAPFICPYQHQNALFIVHSWLDIHTIRSDIDDAPCAEIAFASVHNPPTNLP